MIKPETKPIIQLIGENGNAFAIMGQIKMALKNGGADQEYIDQYLKESMSGDYNNLLVTAMKYAEVE